MTFAWKLTLIKLCGTRLCFTDLPHSSLSLVRWTKEARMQQPLKVTHCFWMGLDEKHEARIVSVIVIEWFNVLFSVLHNSGNIVCTCFKNWITLHECLVVLCDCDFLVSYTSYNQAECFSCKKTVTISKEDCKTIITVAFSFLNINLIKSITFIFMT